MGTDPDGMWFASRRFGYGAGLPIRWQGWAMLAGYVALMLATALLPVVVSPWVWVVLIPIQIAATVVLFAVARRRTRGGWRWRWGG